MRVDNVLSAPIVRDSLLLPNEPEMLIRLHTMRVDLKRFVYLYSLSEERVTHVISVNNNMLNIIYRFYDKNACKRKISV